MLRSLNVPLAVALAFLGTLIVPATAQQQPLRSECLAMANAPPLAMPVSLRRTAAKAEDVAITYVGHSTYYIDTPEGVRIATDFNGAYRTGRLPDVVTMNRAHSTHYTLFPDPKIPHVLHGWGENGQAAHVSTRVGDVYIRNVPTDIRRYYGDDSSGAMLKDGNSIFIFEVAGLCIGHLGHLHHKLDDTHFAAIGRLDILMVPIDGTYTMSLDGISEITKRLRSSIVLPMHRFATPLDEFMRPDRPAIRHRPTDRADTEDLAGHAAGHADGDHSGRGVSLGHNCLPPSLRAQRLVRRSSTSEGGSNPWCGKRRDGLLRCARNDE